MRGVFLGVVFYNLCALLVTSGIWYVVYTRTGGDALSFFVFALFILFYQGYSEKSERGERPAVVLEVSGQPPTKGS